MFRVLAPLLYEGYATSQGLTPIHSPDGGLPKSSHQLPRLELSRVPDLASHLIGVMFSRNDYGRHSHGYSTFYSIIVGPADAHLRLLAASRYIEQSRDNS